MLSYSIEHYQARMSLNRRHNVPNRHTRWCGTTYRWSRARITAILQIVVLSIAVDWINYESATARCCTVPLLYGGIVDVYGLLEKIGFVVWSLRAAIYAILCFGRNKYGDGLQNGASIQ